MRTLHGYGEGCMNSNSTVVETFCCHRFHKTCLDSWLGKKNSCPLCVEMLRQVRLVLLYLKPLTFNENDPIILGQNKNRSRKFCPKWKRTLDRDIEQFLAD